MAAVWGRLLGAALLGLSGPLAEAGGPEDGLELRLREVHNISHYTGVRQQAVELRLPGRDRLIAGERRFALDWVASVGELAWDEGRARTVSIGRGIRWRPLRALPRSELHLSLSPTWVEHTALAGRELGGHLHFTTAAAWVLPLDRAGQRTLALRLQHTSNAGTQADNPGLDLAGIELGWRFGARLPAWFERPPATLTLGLRPVAMAAADPG